VFVGPRTTVTCADERNLDEVPDGGTLEIGADISVPRGKREQKDSLTAFKDQRTGYLKKTSKPRPGDEGEVC
jgi:hypothetical protein